MLFPPLPPEPSDQQRARERAHHREALQDLVTFGINTAKAVERRAIGASLNGENAAIEAAAAFERVARAIRRTILLAEKLAEPITEDPGSRAEAPPPNHPAPPARPESLRSESVRPESVRSESVRAEAAAEDDAPDPSDPEAGQDPQDIDRQDGIDEGADDALLHLPVPDQIAAIRRDLALEAVDPVQPPDEAEPPARQLPTWPRNARPPATVGAYLVGPQTEPEDDPHARERKR